MSTTRLETIRSGCYFEAMTSTPSVTQVDVGKFDPARVFPPGDTLPLPLLRRMLATDDVRHASSGAIIGPGPGECLPVR